MKRFYTHVTAQATPQGWRILLDEKPVRTPGGQYLHLPAAALADMVAQEWRGQGAQIDPVSMPMLRLANTVQDGVTAARDEVIGAILRFGAHDLICYRAASPSQLAARQAQSWDPMIDWAARDLHARLSVTEGIAHVEQPAAALDALRAAVAALDDYALAGLHVLASITGSLVLGLAVATGAVHPAQAFGMSRLDEAHQAEFWGEDSEAAARAAALAREMDVAAVFIAASRL